MSTKRQLHQSVIFCPQKGGNTFHMEQQERCFPPLRWSRRLGSLACELHLTAIAWWSQLPSPGSWPQATWHWLSRPRGAGPNLWSLTRFHLHAEAKLTDIFSLRKIHVVLLQNSLLAGANKRDKLSHFSWRLWRTRELEVGVLGLVRWYSKLILHRLALAPHMDTSSCPGSSTFDPALYLWPRKVSEDGPSPLHPAPMWKICCCHVSFSSSCFFSFFLRFSFSWMTDFTERERKREKVFHLLIHLQNGRNGQNWVDPITKIYL